MALDVDSLTRFGGHPARVLSVASRRTGKAAEPWVELMVDRTAQSVWVPAWALPEKPSEKGLEWGSPTEPDGFTRLAAMETDEGPEPEPEPDLFTRRPSGQQLPPEPEPRKPPLPAKRATVREAKRATCALPPGPLNEALGVLADAAGLSTKEVADILDEPLAAVMDMFEGGRPPFHPALCPGYRALAERLGVDLIDLQRRALMKREKPKKVSTTKRGRKVHIDQEDIWFYRPQSEGR